MRGLLVGELSDEGYMNDWDLGLGGEGRGVGLWDWSLGDLKAFLFGMVGGFLRHLDGGVDEWIDGWMDGWISASWTSNVQIT